MFTIFTKPQCPKCEEAKGLLSAKNLSFEAKTLDVDYTADELRTLVPNARSLPQVFGEGRYIGDLTALTTYLKNNGL